eukprot:12699127-Heterocapsa_arctica.AAC.1
MELLSREAFWESKMDKSVMPCIHGDAIASDDQYGSVQHHANFELLMWYPRVIQSRKVRR